MQVSAQTKAKLKAVLFNQDLFGEKLLKIIDKEENLVPLRMNRVQRYINDRLDAQLKEKGWVRAMLLKARKQGASTQIAARYYRKTSIRANVRAYIMAHEQTASDTLFEMVERFHKHNPLAPSTGAANAKELSFDILDSGYQVGTAGTKDIGRSKTINLLHWSEVAFSPNAKGHFKGVVQAVPKSPGSEIVLESTGNGPQGEFYSRWQDAEAGIGDYIAIFCPWFWTDEYRERPPEGFSLVFDPDDPDCEAAVAERYGLDLEQMAWRRSKIHELGGLAEFKQEFPATPSEAFEFTSHDSFIKPADVLSARKNNREAIGPKIMGFDPSRFGDDRFSKAVRQGRRVLYVESRLKLGTNEAVAWIKQSIDTEQPDAVFMDVGGGGDRIFDILEGYGEPYSDIIKLVNFGGGPREPMEILRDGTKKAGPKNRRAEMYLNARKWLTQEGGVDLPDSDVLQADAIGAGYHYDLVTQQLIIESKEDMRKRKVRSPDEWDAVILTFAEPVRPRRQKPQVKLSTRSGSGQSWLGA